jgi:hypothetical protein
LTETLPDISISFLAAMLMYKFGAILYINNIGGQKASAQMKPDFTPNVLNETGWIRHRFFIPSTKQIV